LVEKTLTPQKIVGQPFLVQEAHKALEWLTQYLYSKATNGHVYRAAYGLTLGQRKIIQVQSQMLSKISLKETVIRARVYEGKRPDIPLWSIYTT